MFKKPTNFDDRLAEVTKRIEELNLKAKSNNQGTPGISFGSKPFTNDVNYFME